MRRMAMKMSNGEIHDDIGYDKGYIWIRSNYSLFQMLFEILIANPKKVFKPRFWRDPLLGYGRGSSYCVGGRRRGQICLHFLILSSFPHFVSHFLHSYLIFLSSCVLVIPITGFGSLWRWLWPDELWYSCLQVTTDQATVIWSYCKILIDSKLSNILIYFQHSSSGRPGSGLHSTLRYLKVTKALLAIY